MKDSDRHTKLVFWSDEDQCYIDRCPDLMDGGCHGSNEKAVFEQLCTLVEEAINLYHQDNKPLPKPSNETGIAA